MIDLNKSDQIAGAIIKALHGEYNSERLKERLAVHGLAILSAEAIGYEIKKLHEQHQKELAIARKMGVPGFHRNTLIQLIDHAFKTGLIDRVKASRLLFHTGIQDGELSEHLDSLERAETEQELMHVTRTDLPEALELIEHLAEKYIEGSITYRELIGILDPERDRPESLYELFAIWHKAQLERLRDHVFSGRQEANVPDASLLKPELPLSWIEYCESDKPCEECPYHKRCYLYEQTLNMRYAMSDLAENAPEAETE